MNECVKLMNYKLALEHKAKIFITRKIQNVQNMNMGVILDRNIGAICLST